MSLLIFMKKFLLFVALFFTTSFLFSENIVFTTGDIAGTGITDHFSPMDFSMLASTATVSAIFKVDKDVWCIRLTANKSGGTSSIPIVYEYYVKKGDKIKMRRICEKGLIDSLLTVVSVDWNKAEFSID